MARNQVETCLWCDSAPCRCNATAEKKVKPRKSLPARPQPKLKTDQPNTAQKTSSPHEVSLEQPQRAGLQSVSFARELSPEEQEYRYALTVLCESGLICSEDIAKNAKDLNLSPTKIRLLIWKQRRAEAIRR
jgi:hypothetical protein